MSRAVERWRIPVVLGLLGCGGAGFAAFRQPWASQRLSPDGLPADTVVVTGADAFPLAAALTIVILTGGLALLAVGAVARRVVGAVVVVASVGALVTMTVAPGALDDALRSAIALSPAFTGGSVEVSTGLGGARLVAWVSFVVAAVLGLVTVVVGGTWGRRSARYEAPGTGRDEADLWSAISEGDDPTL